MFSKYSVKTIEPKEILVSKNNEILIIDETQRIYPQTLDCLFKVANSIQNIIYFFDSTQVYSSRECSSKSLERLDAQEPLKIKLSKKIRTCGEIWVFVRILFDNHENKIDISNNIFIIWSKNTQTSIKIINHFRSKFYTFINYTGSYYCHTNFEKYRSIEDVNTHRTLGLDYNKVVVIMDKTFYISDNTIKANIDYENPYNYLLMLKGSMLRSQDKLVIVVEDNIELYRFLINIVSKQTGED